MYYTEYTVNGKTVVKYVALCANFDAEKIALVDGANTRIGYGNFVGTDSFIVDGEDLNTMLRIVLNNNKADTIEKKIIADVNADGKMDGEDLNEVLRIVLNGNKLPSAATK